MPPQRQPACPPRSRARRLRRSPAVQPRRQRLRPATAGGPDRRKRDQPCRGGRAGNDAFGDQHDGDRRGRGGRRRPRYAMIQRHRRGTLPQCGPALKDRAIPGSAGRPGRTDASGLMLLLPLLAVLVAGCGHGGGQKGRSEGPAAADGPGRRRHARDAGAADPGHGDFAGAARARKPPSARPSPASWTASSSATGRPCRKGRSSRSSRRGSSSARSSRRRRRSGRTRCRCSRPRRTPCSSRRRRASAILQAQAGLENARAALAGAQATLTGNEAGLRNAQQSLDRAQTLYADGLVAQKDVEAAQLALRTAQAQRDAQRQTVAGQRQTVAGQQAAVAAARAAALQDVVKRKDVQVARQQVRNALGALTTARAQVALYTLRAPLAGQVSLGGRDRRRDGGHHDQDRRHRQSEPLAAQNQPSRRRGRARCIGASR